MKDPKAFERARATFRKKTARLDELTVVQEITTLVEQTREQPPATLHLLGVATFNTSSSARSSESSTLSFS